MKSSVVLVVPLACLLAAAGPARADVNYDLAKKQAKRDVSQSDAQQGVAPGQPSAPAAPQAPPADPALAATLQNLANLRADLDALNQAADAGAGADQRSSLMTHLSAAAAPGKKASAAAVRKLAGHLITAVSGRKLLTAHNAALARDLHAGFNGAHLSAAQLQTLVDDLKKILIDAGVPAADADNLVSDLRQIAAETR